MKIALVGASGYGNAGDDTYPIVLRDQFPEHEWMHFNSDLPKAMPSGIDLLVLGGGGLLHNVGQDPEGSETRHFRCMRFYMDWAASGGVPWGILSCGFQFTARPTMPHAHVLGIWASYLKAANFITLRSPVCAQIASELTGRTDIQCFPDLGYLFRPGSDSSPTTENLLTIIPAGHMIARHPFVQHTIRLCQSMDYRVQWLAMGAAKDDGPHLEEAAERYPGSTIVERGGPGRAFAEISRSRLVLSGRYHGMIFARSARVPFLVPQDAPHKIVSEDLSAKPQDAIGHINALRDQLAKAADRAKQV